MIKGNHYSIHGQIAILLALIVSVTPSMAQQAGRDFPEGSGKGAMLSACGSCHDLNRLTAGYTPEGWHRRSSTPSASLNRP
jgi:hypothetical protein